MPGGKRVQRTTKETDRKKAQRLADQFEEASRARQTARTTGEGLPSSSVQAYYEAWLTRKVIDESQPGAGTSVTAAVPVTHPAIRPDFAYWPIAHHPALDH